LNKNTQSRNKNNPMEVVVVQMYSSKAAANIPLKNQGVSTKP
jgi:hypothetical protein